ncbi:MAG: glutathione S-transferase family protein [Candidatus Schekmanbacteria bacterium]|nr:glutathione S-transferase family protein [Candidatus Schekmanbacteria bacterium]
MSVDLALYELRFSPNNIKARVALGYKGLEHTLIPVDPADRGTVIAVSGQPLTPVLKHGSTVIFDSGAILRYLDANFPQAPRLFSADYSKMRAIEEWEHFGRGAAIAPVGRMFRAVFGGDRDPEVGRLASAALATVSERIEARLAEAEWLVGDRMTAADVTVAPPIWYGMLPESVASRFEMLAFFAANLHLGAGRERTRAWVNRVLAHDGGLRL